MLLSKARNINSRKYWLYAYFGCGLAPGFLPGRLMPSKEGDFSMSKTRVVLMLVILVLGIGLTACERPASVAPATAPTSGLAEPQATQSELMKDILSGTQTAMAQNTPKAGEVKATQPAAVKTTEKAAEAQPTPKPTKAVLPSPTAGKPASYTIQKGDHFYCIARRFNVNPGDLASVNGYGTPPATIQPGTSLKIPQSSSWPSNAGARSLKAHPGTYTVQAGDTLNKIACLYGDVSPEAIMAANGMTSSSISAGKTLQIP
jgi:LysM repeat protein